MDSGSPVSSGSSIRDAKSTGMGASELPIGLPIGLGAALAQSPRGAAKRKTSVFNPLNLMGGLNAAAAAISAAAAPPAPSANAGGNQGGID